MKKIYEVGGMMEWHPAFKVGRSSLRVSFTGGHLCGGACTPASYETSDPVVQTVIENSEAFRNGRIRIGKTFSDPDPQPRRAARAPETPKREVAADTSSDVCVFEYTKMDDISDFLQDKKGVPLDILTSDEAIFREAKRLGVTLRLKTDKK